VLTRQEEQILLAVHHLGDNAYLIPIREQVKNYTGKYYSVGTIYAPLNRLYNQGYLEAAMGETNAMRGGKAIKYYTITEKGYQALADLKKAHEKMWDGLCVPGIKKEAPE
jgi:DNA-binding PadR family transcriptional regulator